MDSTILSVVVFFLTFNTLLLTYLSTKVISYLDWKRSWRENRNV